MRQEFLRGLVEKKFGRYVQAPNDFRVNCPFCYGRGRTEDRERKLYMSWDKEIYHCFRCDATGGLKYLFENQIFDIKEQRESDLKEKKDAYRQEIGNRSIELIPDDSVLFSTLNSNHPAYEYMLSRDVDIPVELQYCDNYYRKKDDGHHTYYGSRLIFPVFMNGIYQGFQGRTTRDHPVKYVNGEGFNKSQALYNWDRARVSSTIVLVEGIFDVLRVGLKRTIGIFGKALSDKQRDLILFQRFSKIVIILDKDAVRSSKKIAKELSLFHNNVWYAKIRWKDPGSAPHEEINTLIDSGLSMSSNVGLQRAF